MHRFLPVAIICSAAALGIDAVSADSLAAQQPPRAIRRDIPMTNAIRRAHAAGTRDSTGRPGRNHWQLRTDYAIRVRLDPATQRITGSETITLVNNSPDTLRSISLRLPLNHFLFENPRAASWVPSENTDGMPVSRLMVDGKPATMAGHARRSLRSRSPLRSRRVRAARSRSTGARSSPAGPASGTG